MSYNLTANQKEALRWIVEKARAGSIPTEDAFFSWARGEPSVVGYEGNIPDTIKPGVVEALGHEGLLHVRPTPSGQRGVRIVTLTRRAFDAVDSDFEEDAPTPPQGQKIVYNLHGTGSRVNINSHDESVNIVQVEGDQLFSNLRQTIEEVAGEVEQRQALLEQVDGMEGAEERASFAERYGRFMELASAHITVLNAIMPFVPALQQAMEALPA